MTTTTDSGTKGERTRAKLITTAGELLQRQGYHATGLSQVVEESGAPRGSLYFHFPGGKEELAIAALRESGESWRLRIEEAIDRAPDLGGAVTAVFNLFANELRSSNWKLGCPLATVALEASESNEPVREVCAAHFVGWEVSIAARLRAAGMHEAMAQHVATFVLAAVEGALLLARTQRSTRPLEIVADTLRSMIKV